MTHISWPAGQLRAFYEEFIANRSHASHYSSLLDPHINNSTELQMKSLISQNFAGLQMYVDKATFLEFYDRPQLPLIGFISQLGGALNLWAGITVVVVIELVELGYDLIVTSYRKQTEIKHSDSDDFDVGEKLDVLPESNVKTGEEEWLWCRKRFLWLVRELQQIHR